jgi:DnaJ-class molecular chaperone
MSVKKHSEIEICHSCKGKGVIIQEKLTCYHRGEYDYWTEECPECKGSGLLQKTIITETIIEPYKPLTPEPLKK